MSIQEGLCRAPLQAIGCQTSVPPADEKMWVLAYFCCIKNYCKCSSSTLHVFIILSFHGQASRLNRVPASPVAALNVSVGLCSFPKLRVPFCPHMAVGRIHLLSDLGLRSPFSPWPSVRGPLRYWMSSGPHHVVPPTVLSNVDYLFLQDWAVLVSPCHSPVSVHLGNVPFDQLKVN